MFACASAGAQQKVLPGVAHACFDDVDNVNLLSLLTGAGITQSLTQVTGLQGAMESSKAPQHPNT